MSNVEPNEIEARYARIQDVPEFYDYLKHLTTLSTGSIILIVTFADNFANKPSWAWLFTASLILFLVSMLSSLVCMFLTVSSKSTREEDGDSRLIALSFAASIWSIALGCFCIALFAFRNFGS